MDCKKDDPRTLLHDMIPVLVKFDKENPVLYNINIDKNEFKIGRGRENDEILFNLLISRFHCIFECDENEEWTITNKSSTGTFLNGRRLVRGKPESVCVGDVLQFSESERFKYLFTMRFSDEIIREKKSRIDKSLLNYVKQKLDKFSEQQEEKKKRLEKEFSMQLQEQNTLRQKLDELLEKQKSESETIIVIVELIRLIDSLRLGNKIGMELYENYRKFVFSLKEEKEKFENEINEKRRIWQSTWSMMEQEQRNIERRMVQLIAEWSTSEQEKISKSIEIIESERKSILEKIAKECIFLEQMLEETQDKRKAMVEKFKEKTIAAGQLESTTEKEVNEEDDVVIVEDMDEREEKNDGIINCINEKVSSSQMKDDGLRDKVENILDEQLTCIVCSELFVSPTTLNCTHTFCEYCIQSWQKKSSECPICRSTITSLNKSRVIDDVIEQMVSELSSEFRTRRDQLISERQMS